MMAALALMTASCSKENNLAEQPANDEITITATIGAATRALAPDGDNINSTWEATDEFAILFNDGSTDVKRIATVSSINGSSVTITFTIPQALANNTPCTIVYPASAANAANTGADVATALATQDGTIGNCPEVRVGTATIDKVSHCLTGVTKLAAQNAIFKFTLQDLNDAAKSATEFKVSDGSGNVITTVTPSPANGELYVAIPVLAAGTYWFNATVDSKPYIAKATTADATIAGKYYQTTVKMATVGDMIKSDGKFYKVGTSGAVAMIAYVGSASDCNHGLAIALTDEANSGNPMIYSEAETACSGKTSVTGCTWRLPSAKDWQYMFIGCGSGETYSDPVNNMERSYSALYTKLSTAGGTVMDTYYYWSSTWHSYGTYAWDLSFMSDPAVFRYSPVDFKRAVRACLTF